MNTKKREDLLNEKINPQVEKIADLPVTDEQSQQAKGGGDIVPTDQFTLNFTEVKFRYEPRK